MIVFLLLSVPCWVLFINSFFRSEGIRKRDFFIPLGKGAVLYVAALLLTWFFTDKLVLGQVTPLRLFFYDYLYYNGFTQSLWLLFYLLGLLLSNKGRNDDYRFREILLLLGASFMGESLYRVVIRESWYGLYELFFLPLGNMAMIIILAVLLVRMDRAALPGRLLLFLISLGVVFLYNIVPTLFSLNLPVPAVLSGIFLFTASLIVFRAEMGGDLPFSHIKYRNE